MTKTDALATVHVRHATSPAGGCGRDGRGARSRSEYYRAYYHALVENASGREGRRGIENIKWRRRQARRGNWLQSLKSLTGVMHETLS